MNIWECIGGTPVGDAVESVRLRMIESWLSFDLSSSSVTQPLRSLDHSRCCLFVHGGGYRIDISC